MPEPLAYPPGPWTPSRRPLGDCRHCGLPACTVDVSRTVCHVGCGAETATAYEPHSDLPYGYSADTLPVYERPGLSQPEPVTANSDIVPPVAT